MKRTEPSGEMRVFKEKSSTNGDSEVDIDKLEINKVRVLLSGP